MKTLYFVLLCMIVISCSNIVDIAEFANPVNKEVVYIKYINWGWNESKVLISLNNEDIDTENDYDFGEGSLLYKTSNDTIYVYAHNYSVPKINKFKTHIIVINDLDARIDFRYYKDYGLKRIPKKKKGIQMPPIN